MATATPTEDKSLATSSAAGQSTPDIQVLPPNRREFLYYIWTASMAMLFGQFTVVGLWFAYPRFGVGEFGGEFIVDPATRPPQGAPPQWNPTGRFHISNTEEGLLALYGVCTHLGCLPKWVSTNNRFECPCHGSKFEANGDYIEGPAPRGLDRFPVTITYADGVEVTNSDASGGPIELDPNKTIVGITVDTGSRSDGSPRA